MAETDVQTQYTYSKPNFIDKLTLLVLAGTLGFVWRYTHLTSRLLEADTRPFLKIVPTTGQLNDQPQEGRPLTMKIALINYGKLRAIANTRATITYSPTQLPAPGLFDNNIIKSVWPLNDNAVFDAQSSEALSSVDIANMRNGKGWVYVEVDAAYRSYVTRICWEYPVTTDRMYLGDPSLCSDSGANCVDDECQ